MIMQDCAGVKYDIICLNFLTETLHFRNLLQTAEETE